MVYTGDGDLIEIEQVIGIKAVPRAVVKSARKAHPKAKITVAEKLTRGSETLYEFHMRKGKKKFEVVLDPTGKIVETEPEEKEEKEEKEKPAEKPAEPEKAKEAATP
jgi:hypothetical protein